MDYAAILDPNSLALGYPNMAFYILALGNKYGTAIGNTPNVARIALALLGRSQQ